MKTNEISIILTTDHVETSLNLLLEDLLAQTHKQFEVIVVDLSRIDQNGAIFENYRDKLDLHIIQLDGQKASVAKNLAVEKAKYERLLFLNPRLRLSPDFIYQSLSRLNKQQLWLASGKLQVQDAPLIMRLAVEGFNLLMWLSKFMIPLSSFDCLFSTKQIHHTIGGFDIHEEKTCNYLQKAAKTFHYNVINASAQHPRTEVEQQGILKFIGKYLRDYLRLLVKNI
ncbi:glycosyltransferase family 2 protein [Pasteurella oralis]|uniref:Glycosyltransferase family 2 protein n=1 Tax=Pasteurella oralis TaxID=1071947 RepID=A0ABW4NVG0_9PAST|nr:glycosyltransferase family A protein [Pasteurella oralis]